MAKFNTQFMRNQWKIINADKILTEKEVHALVQTVEKYLDRPGSEGVREIVNDYDAFTGYVKSGVSKGIFPAMWTQYLQSAKMGFRRYKSYQATLPKGTPVPANVPPPAAPKLAAKPAFPTCCQEEWKRLKTLLKVSMFIDVYSLVTDVNAFSKGMAKNRSKALRDPETIAGALGLASTSIGSLLPVAARNAELHAYTHSEDDAYLEAWWTKLAEVIGRHRK